MAARQAKERARLRRKAAPHFPHHVTRIHKEPSPRLLLSFPLFLRPAPALPPPLGLDKDVIVFKTERLLARRCDVGAVRQVQTLQLRAVGAYGLHPRVCHLGGRR